MNYVMYRGVIRYIPREIHNYNEIRHNYSTLRAYRLKINAMARNSRRFLMTHYSLIKLLWISSCQINFEMSYWKNATAFFIFLDKPYIRFSRKQMYGLRIFYGELPVVILRLLFWKDKANTILRLNFSPIDMSALLWSFIVSF